jgi:hypothetical protein
MDGRGTWFRPLRGRLGTVPGGAASGSRHSRPRRGRNRVPLLLVALLGACEFGERTIAPGVERPVVHVVLNPSAASAAVLVERTLTGKANTQSALVVDPTDPIRSGGGVPISGARVVVADADGNQVVAEEQRMPAGGGQVVGTGVYRFTNVAVSQPSMPGGAPPAGLRVVRGGRYALRVETPDGTVVTGEATVPGVEADAPEPRFDRGFFNRDRDTLRLSWPAVPGARAYALQVETPYGAFYLFTDSTSFRLTGELRNLFAERLPRVFQAGFTQYLYVAAVDSNYYDYYRSGNNVFTGSGLINRLHGGIGLFGAYVPLLSRVVFVRADNDDPFDGRYASPSYNGEETLQLWVDTRGTISEVTGAYRIATGDQYGVVGTLEGNRLRLHAITSDDVRFVFRTLDGTVAGDTISITLGGAVAPNDPGTRRFVRVRAVGPAAP